MRKVDVLLEAYGESHQTSFNKKIHYFCVPAIFFSVLGLLYCIPVSTFLDSFLNEPWLQYTNLATVLIVFGVIYYATLSMRLMAVSYTHLTLPTICSV